MGEGMSWKGSDNLLFESALIVGVDSVKVSDMARASDPSYNSGDFLIVKAISVSEPGLEAPLETYSEYKDLVDSTRAGAKIQNSYYQFVNPEMEDCVIGIYDIINRNENFVDSMFAGLYFDWDIGTSGAYNQIKWDFDNKIALCYNTKTDSLPNVGVMILSEHNENFYAIDNDGSSEDNPGVYDGFTKSEKWKMISSGIGRATSEIKDVSMVLAAGPISLRPDDTNRVIFGILASNSTESLIEKSKKIRAFMQSISSVYGNFLSQPKITLISKIYPNPVANGYLNIELFHQKVNYIIYNITDINGREIEKSIYRSLTNVSDLMPGIMNLTLDVRNFAQGAYLLNLKTDKGFDTVKFVISK